jgi:hypothetical protein
MTPEDLFQLAIQLLTYASIAIVAHLGGRSAAERKHARLNAAKVECVECPHETGPRPLSAAMAAAAGHSEATGHRCMVVKAA